MVSAEIRLGAAVELGVPVELGVSLEPGVPVVHAARLAIISTTSEDRTGFIRMDTIDSLVEEGAVIYLRTTYQAM